MKKDLLRRLLKLSFAALYALLMVFSGCSSPSGDDPNLQMLNMPGGPLNPFRITNEADLRKVGTGVDGWTLEAHYRLEADIDLTGRADWTRIGIGTSPLSSFTGIFDGNDKTITGLRINAPDISYQGMFGVIGLNGVVKNLGLLNVTITGNNNVGGLAGNSYNSTIQNCYVSGSVTGNDYVGGLVGRIISDGGIGNRGYTSTIQNSYAVGAITGNNSVGGLAGNCYSRSTIQNSYASGFVTGNIRVGGLVGSNLGTIQNSYATGAVTGNSNVGGLVGWNDGTIQNSYATGAVTGNYSVGGLAGYNSSTIQNSVAFNSSLTRTGSVYSSFGRILGRQDGTLFMNYGYSGMSFVNVTPDPPVSSSGSATVHGADFSIGESYSTLFNPGNGWSSENWIIPAGNLSANGSLPTLRNMPGQTQNPRGP